MTKKKKEQSAKTADLSAFKEDVDGQYLTTNQGLRINDDLNSLKAGERGPSLLGDFHLRERLLTSTMNGFLSVSCMRVVPPPMGISSCTNRWPH